MNYIYLIGTTGAARTLHEDIWVTERTLRRVVCATGAARTLNKDMARTLEQCANYRRCTQKEYLQRMREIRILDTPAEPTGFDRTASDPAGTTPAIPLATPLAGRQQHRQQKDAL